MIIAIKIAKTSEKLTFLKRKKSEKVSISLITFELIENKDFPLMLRQIFRLVIRNFC